MSDRERDRSAVPCVHRYRCAACKTPIIANTSLCSTFFDRGGASGHHCVVYFDDKDEKATSAKVEQRGY